MTLPIHLLKQNHWSGYTLPVAWPEAQNKNKIKCRWENPVNPIIRDWQHIVVVVVVLFSDFVSKCNEIFWDTFTPKKWIKIVQQQYSILEGTCPMFRLNRRYLCCSVVHVPFYIEWPEILVSFFSHVTHVIHKAAWPHCSIHTRHRRRCSSDFVLADLPVRSPRKLFILIITICTGSKYPNQL